MQKGCLFLVALVKKIVTFAVQRYQYLNHRVYLTVMQIIKVHIRQLGLIKDADLEISPMMVFSGESGLGKSYVAILCHYFFSVWLSEKRFDDYFKSFLKSRIISFSDSSENIPDKGTALIIKKNELEDWLAEDAVKYVGYMIGYDGLSGSIQVHLPSSIGDTITFLYERELMGINNSEDLFWKLSVLNLTYRFRQLGIQDESPYAYILRFAILDELFGNYQSLKTAFVLPPSRGSYFTEEIKCKTGLFKSFVEGMSALEGVCEIKEKVSGSSVALFKSLLDGDIQKVGDQYTYKTHGSVLPVAAAASSVREMAPLQLIVNKKDISKTVILVEEPEAHLHPKKQVLMADALAAMAVGGAMMQITTHSDYFLRRFNDLVRLNIIKSKVSEENYILLCDKLQVNPALAISIDLVSAYYLERVAEDSVCVRRQNISNGIPFDTFEQVNGKPLSDSSFLYELSLETLSDEDFIRQLQQYFS